MMKKFPGIWYLVGLVVFLGIFLRVYNIPQTLLFHFDQGYHGLAIRDIWETKRIALLGHKTDVEGIFHGSFFYYLMLPLYLISGWNPAGVSSILAVLDGLTVIFIFLLGKELFSKQVGILAAGFYTVSYPLISYSRWLSNVTLIPLFSSLFFFFLLKSYQEKIYFFPVAALFVGIVAQLNGAIGFFLVLLLIISLFLLRRKIFRTKLFFFLTIFLFITPAIPLILFDVRHQFLVTSSILSLFSRGKTNLGAGQFLSHFNLFQGEFTNLLSYKLPILAIILFLTVLAALFHGRKTKGGEFKPVKTLLLFLLVPLLGLLFYPGGIHQFFFIGILPLLVIFIAWGLIYWMKVKILKPAIIVFVLLIVFVNLFYWQGFLKPGFNLIPIGTRNLITLDDRLEALDFIYKQAQGEPFQTPIYIIPYNQEQPWDYVFAWYGKKKYGYLPTKYSGKTFVIYEPDFDFPYRLTSWLGKIEEDHGGVISSFKAHDLIVEEREK